MKYLYNEFEVTCWDNEDAGDAAAAAAAAAAASADAATAQAAADAAAAADAPKTFTQDEVNKFVADRNKSANTLLKQLEENNKKLLENQNLTAGERDKLESDLDAVRNEMMTKEQRQDAASKKASESHKKEVDGLTEERDKYQNLYESSTINREIQDAAIKSDGFSPSQFINHLAPLTKMAPEVDGAGIATGKMVPKVEWKTVDSETNEIKILTVSPEEAVQLMKDNVVDFGNMFKPNVASGIGQGTAPGQRRAGGPIDHSAMTTEEYMAAAKDPAKRAAMLGKK